MALRDLVAHLSQGTQSMTRDELREEWQRAVDTFYDRVEKIICPLIDEHFVSTERDYIEITEPRIGTYSILQLAIYSGPKSITFRPIARIVAGATGRIDVYGQHENIGYRLLRMGFDQSEIWNIVAFPKVNALMPKMLSGFGVGQPTPEDSELVELTDRELEDLLERMFAV